MRWERDCSSLRGDVAVSQECLLLPFFFCFFLFIGYQRWDET